MGKLTFKGQVPPDDPMFLSGPQIFSRLGSNPSSMSSASDTDGETPVVSSAAQSANQIPSEESLEGQLLDGARRIARFKHQNAEFARLREEGKKKT